VPRVVGRNLVEPHKNHGVFFLRMSYLSCVLILRLVEIEIGEVFVPNKLYQRHGDESVGSTQIEGDVESTVVISGGVKAKKKKLEQRT